jgi:hypothetical protein
MKPPKWLHLPHTRLGQFAFYGLAELVSFAVITANFRAIAQGNYWYAGVTDFMNLVQGFAIGKFLMDDAEQRTWYTGLGAAVGGTCGTLLAIWITKHVYGQ